MVYEKTRRMLQKQSIPKKEEDKGYVKRNTADFITGNAEGTL